MILFLHNRYRTLGGEERAVDDLAWLVREHLGEPVELLERDSRQLGVVDAARGLLRGGEAPDEVAAAVERSGARILHAHNLNPSFGPRSLLAARAAGAAVVLHLHNYRLVCAVGTCVDPGGADCTRCHGRDTRPGVRRNCRESRPQSLVYAAAIAGHAARLAGAADAVVVPSDAARERLRALGAPLGRTAVHVVGHVVKALDEAPSSAQDAAGETRSSAFRGSLPADGFALVASRLAREKAVDLAVEACDRVGVALVVAGEGPERGRLEQQARGKDVRFLGHVSAAELGALRARAGVAVVPTRAHETFGLAAVEAMAAGLPTVVIARGALAELGAGAELVPPEDAAALGAAVARVRGRVDASRRALAAARTLAAPAVVAPRLAEVYESAVSRKSQG